MTPAPRNKLRARAGIVDVIVVGAGHSGLAMSKRLNELSIDHVVLERGEVGNSWRRERWDSLTLLTPNWMTRLPGKDYAGNDPDGYMDSQAVVDFLSAYAEESAAPVRTSTTVQRVQQCDGGYCVVTDRGTWHCRALVLASGACNEATVPACAAAVPGNVVQLTAMDYKQPAQLPQGRVLVVGASATGLQLAQEIHASGRPVTLAVGEHVRMPRRYRGLDVQWWMLVTGILDQCIDEVDDPVRVRRLPSPQLIGNRDHADLDLNALARSGVQLAGRLAGIRDGKAQFSGSLRNVCALADLKMRRLLKTFDDFAAKIALRTDAAAGEPEPTHIGDVPLGLDFHKAGIRGIVWATGYRPDYSWLQVPVLDRKGLLLHDGGVVASPGLYALGLPFLRRRKSSFIHGAEADVRDLAAHLAAYLGQMKVPTGVPGSISHADRVVSQQA